MELDLTNKVDFCHTVDGINDELNDPKTLYNVYAKARIASLEQRTNIRHVYVYCIILHVFVKDHAVMQP